MFVALLVLQFVEVEWCYWWRHINYKASTYVMATSSERSGRESRSWVSLSKGCNAGVWPLSTEVAKSICRFWYASSYAKPQWPRHSGRWTALSIVVRVSGQLARTSIAGLVCTPAREPENWLTWRRIHNGNSLCGTYLHSASSTSLWPVYWTVWLES